MYRSCAPPAPLAAFVKLLWYWEGPPEAHARERLMPNGEVAVVINLREESARVYDRSGREALDFRGAAICGSHSEFFAIDTDCKRHVAGIQFRAGGAFPFFPMPCGEFHNRHVALDAAWGASAGELREKLVEAPTPDARLRVLERTLLERLASPPDRNPCVEFALRWFQSGRARTVGDVTDRIGISSRHFIRRFVDEVGMTPKLFCRVHRFQRLLQRIEPRRDVDWAAAALDCGYFDQAHFIHDFRSFSGLNPSLYLQYRTEHLNHVQFAD